MPPDKETFIGMNELEEAKKALKEGNLVMGIALLTQVLAKDENMVEARLLRAQTLMAMGDKSGAEADFKLVAEQHPELLGDLTGDYTAEGVEHRLKCNRTNLNPHGI